MILTMFANGENTANCSLAHQTERVGKLSIFFYQQESEKGSEKIFILRIINAEWWSYIFYTL